MLSGTGPAGAIRKLYAFEMKEDALELLRLNKERFHCDNMEIVAGEASEEIERLRRRTVCSSAAAAGIWRRCWTACMPVMRHAVL